MGISAYVKDVYARQSDPCPARYFRLFIHDSEEELREAGMAYSKARGLYEELGSAVGLFQPSDMRSKYDRKKRMWVSTNSSFAGVMRLCDGYLNGGIIVHESTHAALHIWRMQRWHETGGESASAYLSDHVDRNEEDFAYLLSEIAASVNDIVLQYNQDRYVSNTNGGA